MRNAKDAVFILILFGREREKIGCRLSEVMKMYNKEILYKNKKQTYQGNDFKKTIVDVRITLTKQDLFPRIGRHVYLAKKSFMNKEKCVYVLWLNNEVTYVGQTAFLENRIYGHLDKEWNFISILQTEETYKRVVIEAYLIHHYQPKYNKEGMPKSTL